MFQGVIGILLFVLGIFNAAIKLHVVFTISRDPSADGGVPTLDGIIFPPIYMAVGVGMIGKDFKQFYVSDNFPFLVLTATAVAMGILYKLMYFFNRRTRARNLEKFKNSWQRENENKSQSE